VAEKLELILRHSVFELSFGEAALGRCGRMFGGLLGASLPFEGRWQPAG
jgi:hypothetical protein